MRAPRTRATTEEAKLARRASLLAAAKALFASREFDEVSMEEVARKAGLAKGTVSLYFGTKEGLFLELVAEEMSEWRKETSRRLGKGASGPEVAAVVASTLSKRPALVRLLALLHAVLERNSDIDALRAFKKRLLEITLEAARSFGAALGLEQETGARLTLWMHAMTVGLAQMTAACPSLIEVLAQDDALAVFRLDFRQELEAGLATLFAGAGERFGADALRGRRR